MVSEAAMERSVVLQDFSGGLNNVGDIASLADNQLSQIVNMEVDSNGALVARPPITRYAELPNPNSPVEMLGYYSRGDGAKFIVIANVETYLFNYEAMAWTQIATFAASACAQYQNRLYICCRTARGGWWGETTPGSGTYTYQSLAGGEKPMPFGDHMVVYKDRLWMSGWGSPDERTKVYISEETNTVGGDINNWPPLNFFYVGRGDGQVITRLHAGSNDITIFRNQSSFYFIYEDDPGRGVLSRYEGDIGTENKYTIALKEDYLYTLSGGTIYQLVGYRFYARNNTNQLKFERRGNSSGYEIDAAISSFDDRLIVWHQGETYVMNFNTMVWSQWESDTGAAVFRTAPRNEGDFSTDVAYGLTGFNTTGARAIFRIAAEFTLTESEQMACRIRTKAYDFGQPDRNKVLFWWGADAYTGGDVSGTAVPVAVKFLTVTEDDMDGVSEDVLELGTEDYPLVRSPQVRTDRPAPLIYPYRLSYKFLKKMRFRRIYFEVAFDTDGTLNTGPSQLFSLTMHVDMRQKTTKGIN